QGERRLERARALGEERRQVKARALAKVEHLRSAALRDLHETDLFQSLDRLAYHVAVDAEDLAQLTLGRDRRSRRVAAADDLRGELLENPVGQRALLDGLQGHLRDSLAAGTTSVCAPHAGSTGS